MKVSKNTKQRSVSGITVWLFILHSAFCILHFSNSAYSQANIRDSAIAFPMIGVSFQYQIPQGDMADEFGNNLNAGGFFQWKLKNNTIFGIEGEFLFAESIKNKNLLAGISTSTGDVINEDGEFSSINLLERGFRFSL